MADGVKVRPSTATDAVEFHADLVTYDAKTALVERVKVGFGAPDNYADVHVGNPLPTQEGGTYGYAAGTSAVSVDVPTGARLQRVSVIAASGAAATITIGGGPPITVPANGSFDEVIPGQAIGADVVFGGSLQSYYVAWVV